MCATNVEYARTVQKQTRPSQRINAGSALMKTDGVESGLIAMIL